VASFIIGKGVKKGDTVYVTLKDNELVIEMKKPARHLNKDGKKVLSNIKVAKPSPYLK
jgi:hypothetical protein